MKPILTPIRRKSVAGSETRPGWKVARGGLTLLVCVLAVMAAGCNAIDFNTSALQPPTPPEMEPPSELDMVSLPPYRIETPDVIRIETMALIPKQPYRIDAQDVLMIKAYGTPQQMPIDNYYSVSEEGIVDLGPAYGVVPVMGRTVAEANEVVLFSLRLLIPDIDVSVQLIRSADAEEISDDYQVQLDGTVNLGRYGIVSVAGKTVAETRELLLKHLDQYFESLQLGVDVIGYNSEGYYVIIAGDESGERVRRFRITGNETVLDALANIKGLPRVSSKTMWLARPTPGDANSEQVLPIDWDAIARGGIATSNYQLMPGDRLFIVDDNLVATDQFIGRVTTPLQRLLGIGSLGANTIRGMQVLGRDYNLDRRLF